MPKPKKIIQKSDFEFDFLLDLDPGLNVWLAWMAEYWATLPSKNLKTQTALRAFLVTYLKGQGLHALPHSEFFAADSALPALDSALKLARIKDEKHAQQKHDSVSDFVDWVLHEKLSVLDASGDRVVPPHLANPFPRKRIKRGVKESDLTFAHVLNLDSKLEDWRSLAAEWLKHQKMSVSQRRRSLDRFLVHYIHGQHLERNYGRFLMCETRKPDFAQVLVASKQRGTKALQAEDVRVNNWVSEFLDWVLATQLGDPDTVGMGSIPVPQPRLPPDNLGPAHEDRVGQGVTVHPLHPRTTRPAGRGAELPRLGMGAGGDGGRK